MSHSKPQSEVSDVSAFNGVSERNVVVGSKPVDATDGLATAADVVAIRSAKVPPAVDKNPPRGLGDPFTAEVNNVLSSREVLGYFGTRVSVPALLAAAERFATLDAIRTRLENSVELAAQISAPDGLLIEDALSKVMQNWSDFQSVLPKEALALEPLRALWSSAHPGRKPAKKEKVAKVKETAEVQVQDAKEVAAAPGVTKP